MAISKKEFDQGNFKRRVYSRTDHPVYRFLEAHQSQAFTIHEISKQINMKEETIRSMLAELIHDGLVAHKTPYWAVKHRKRK